MKSGPVPSHSYDLVKNVRSGWAAILSSHAHNAFDVRPDHRIVILREPDLNFLSRSERKCLDESLKENGNLTFGQLKAKSHDAAYDTADENDFISFGNLVASLPNSELVFDHLYGDEK